MSVGTLTVPNLSEHLSSAEITEQLSARGADWAAMKSMNDLLCELRHPTISGRAAPHRAAR